MDHSILPYHEKLTTEDPLGMYEGEDCPVLQCNVLSILLSNALEQLKLDPQSSVQSFVSLLEDLAYSIHGNGRLDASYLKTFLSSEVSAEIIEASVRHIIEAATVLPDIFASQELPYLSSLNPQVALEKSKVRNLLAHEVLGTLKAPVGNDWGVPGFLSWYGAGPHHAAAVTGYLKTIFLFFERAHENEDGQYIYRIFDAANMMNPFGCTRKVHLNISIVSRISDPSQEVEKAPFVLVAANQQPGPGPTATQEERLQASSPALTIISFLCPRIPNDSAVVTSHLPVLSSWSGHNREARLCEVFSSDKRPLRSYILADALPLDEQPPTERGILKDLLPGHVEREVKKLYAAFSGAKVMASKDQLHETGLCMIESPAWGCGAFGGNLLVKALCMMVAAGLADVYVRLLLTADRADEAKVLQNLLDEGPEVCQLWRMLMDLENGTADQVEFRLRRGAQSSPKTEAQAP